MGEDDRDFKWNNYITRYHTRHLDLMDLLAMYQTGPSRRWTTSRKLCGLPGKLGMDGSKVWPAWREGKIDDIRRLLRDRRDEHLPGVLPFQRMRGALSDAEYEKEIALFRSFLAEQKAAHWKEFSEAWK